MQKGTFGRRAEKGENVQQSATGKVQNTSQQLRTKMTSKESKSPRVVQGQNRKRRLHLTKTLHMEEMREAAQLARSYFRVLENQNLGSQVAEISPSLIRPFECERMLQFSSAPAKLLSPDLMTLNGAMPGLNFNPAAAAVNKRRLVSQAAEESRLKRLRKIADSANLETRSLGKFGNPRSTSPLLPSPPSAVTLYDTIHETSGLQFLPRSPLIAFPGEPPSPTHKPSILNRNSEARLDRLTRLASSADANGDAMTDHIKRSATFSRLRHHFPAKLSDSHQSSLSRHIGYLDELSEFGSLRPQDNPLLSSRLDNRRHLFPVLANGHKSHTVSDGAYLSQVAPPHLSRPTLAAYLGHIGAVQNRPHSDLTHGQSSFPSNPCAGILPLPVLPELKGRITSPNTISSIHPDNGILPLPDRPSMALTQGSSQGLDGSSGQVMSRHGDLSHKQQDYSRQLAAVGIGRHSLLPSSTHCFPLSHDLSSHRLTHPLLPSPAVHNDMVALQLELSAQQRLNNSSAGILPAPVQGELDALQLEFSGQLLPSSLRDSSPLPNDMASLQHELLTRRLSAGQHQLLPVSGSLALLQQDYAAHGLDGVRSSFLHPLTVHGELSALQHDLDIQRLNGATYPVQIL